MTNRATIQRRLSQAGWLPVRVGNEYGWLPPSLAADTLDALRDYRAEAERIAQEPRPRGPRRARVVARMEGETE